jgi:hypothetical protein
MNLDADTLADVLADGDAAEIFDGHLSYQEQAEWLLDAAAKLNAERGVG